MTNEAIFQINPEWDIHRNAATLEKLMRTEREAHGCRGYFFFFGDDENVWHKNASPAMRTSAFFMAQNALNCRRSVRVFRNMNGEIAARLA